MQLGLLILVEVDIVIQYHNYLESNRMYIDKNCIIAWSLTFVATNVMNEKGENPTQSLLMFPAIFYSII